MENNEKLFIKAVVDLCRLEYKSSKRLPKVIGHIYDECVRLADESGMTLDEYIDKKLRIN